MKEKARREDDRIPLPWPPRPSEQRLLGISLRFGQRSALTGNWVWMLRASDWMRPDQPRYQLEEKKTENQIYEIMKIKIFQN